MRICIYTCVYTHVLQKEFASKAHQRQQFSHSVIQMRPLIKILKATASAADPDHSRGQAGGVLGH